MHSRTKGKSGSKRPLATKKPEWLQYKAKEIEMMIVKLGKQGNDSAMIGTILRDSYGIPSVRMATGKKISAILQEKKLSKDLPEDLISLIRKSIQLSKHLEENRQDKTARRGLQLTTSKINRLVDYYKKSGAIDADWKFKQQDASFYVD